MQYNATLRQHSATSEQKYFFASTMRTKTMGGVAGWIPPLASRPTLYTLSGNAAQIMSLTQLLPSGYSVQNMSLD
jgi:hypothetical protein